MKRLDDLKAQRAQLDSLIASGVLTGDAARSARDQLEAEILARVLLPEAAPRPSGRLLAGLATFVLLFGLAGYAWLGNPAALVVAPGASAEVPPAAGGHDASLAQFEAMAARLAARLKTQPDDAEGWSMLGRSYTVLARYPEAVAAYRRLLQLQPQDAQAHADAADALGMANGRRLDGEPETLVQRALQLDADNPKARSLAGTLAFNRGDAAAAVRHWEHALRKLDPDSEMAGRLRGAVDEARQAAGLPALARAASAPGDAAAAAAAAAASATAASTEAAPAAPALAAAAAASSPVPADAARAGTRAAVQVRITLAPALAAAAAPEDTLFIFARAAQGPRLPLAIQRRRVKDLPLEVTLDDSMAMSPATRLSSATQVVVGARISKSGNALPQPGDLQGLSAVVAVGTRGLQLQIGERLP